MHHPSRGVIYPRLVIVCSATSVTEPSGRNSEASPTRASAFARRRGRGGDGLVLLFRLRHRHVVDASLLTSKTRPKPRTRSCPLVHSQEPRPPCLLSAPPPPPRVSRARARPPSFPARRCCDVMGCFFNVSPTLLPIAVGEKRRQMASPPGTPVPKSPRFSPKTVRKESGLVRGVPVRLAHNFLTQQQQQRRYVQCYVTNLLACHEITSCDCCRYAIRYHSATCCTGSEEINPSCLVWTKTPRTANVAVTSLHNRWGTCSVRAAPANVLLFNNTLPHRWLATFSPQGNSHAYIVQGKNNNQVVPPCLVSAT